MSFALFGGDFLKRRYLSNKQIVKLNSAGLSRADRRDRDMMRQSVADEQFKRDKFFDKRRRRSERHRAAGLVSRGVALILVFIVIMFCFNFFGLQSLGAQSSSVVTLNHSYDGSDVSLTRFTFYDSNGSFDLLERAFSGIADLCSFVSDFFGSSFGLDQNYVYYLYDSYEDVAGVRFYSGREFIVGIRYDQNAFAPLRSVSYCSLPNVVFFSVSSGPSSALNVAVYDVDENLIKRFYAVPVSVVPGGGLAQGAYWKRFKSYPLALQSGNAWKVDGSVDSVFD